MSEKNGVEARLQDGLVAVSQTRGHTVIADEPIEDGGTDTAMTPTELLLSSLASCKLITMRLVANRKNWNTEGMHIFLDLDEETNTIHQTIRFPEHLTDEQKEKLTQISHKCPVSKLVTGTLHITDTL